MSACCLADASAATGLPVTALAGTTTGTLEAWGDDPDCCLFDGGAVSSVTPLARAAVTAVSCLNARQSLSETARVAVACDAGGSVGVFRLSAAGLDRSATSKVHQAATTAIHVDPFSGTSFVSCAEDGAAVVNDLNRLGTVVSLADRARSAALNSCLFLGPDRVALGGTSRGSLLQVWDIRSSSAVESLTFPEGVTGDCVTSLAAHPSLPYQLVAGDIRGRVSVWDLRMNSALTALQWHTGSVSCLAFHPDKSNIVLSAGSDSCVRSLDLVTGPNPVNEEDEDKDFILDFMGMPCVGLALSMDELAGPLLMCAAEDETLLLKALYDSV